MKNLATAYTYNPVNKTLTLTGLNVPLSYLLLIVNATRGQIVYNLADPSLAAANFVQGANSVLTLNASVDTSFHNASDALTIFYDDGVQTNTLLIQGPAGPKGDTGDPGSTTWAGITDKPATLLQGNAPAVIDVNSTSPALRVTQTGEGHAFVVEDSSHPDATPFFIDKFGNANLFGQDTVVRFSSPASSHNRIALDFQRNNGATRLWTLVQDPSATSSTDLALVRLIDSTEPKVLHLRQNGSHTANDNWLFTGNVTINGTLSNSELEARLTALSNPFQELIPSKVFASDAEAAQEGVSFGGLYRHSSGAIKWMSLLDPDAEAFITASGAQDIYNINQFVLGLKDLGLWNNMVCWPLRSSQNAGTGPTAYSLGGLGAFNGTLSNGPTWGADGVNFNSTAAHIAVNGIIAQPLTVMGAVNFKTTTNGGALIDGSNRVTLFNGGEVAQAALFAGATLASGSNTFSPGNNFIAAYANGASSIVYVNGLGRSGNAGSNLLGNESIIIGNNNSLSYGNRNLDIAFCAIFSGQAYNDAVRALYKSTLGQGLELP